jgi:glycosyltransferase domain-containing protein
MRSIYDKLTILITAHDGHQYLKRLLAHHANTRFKILVADSSPNRITSDLLNENTRYIYTPGMGIGEKLLQAYKQVQTEFVVWNSDDDFLVEKGLVEAIRFLQNNPDYSSIHGKIFFKDKGYHVSYRNRAPIEGDSIHSRLDALADKQYNNNLFSVNKTKDMCKIYEEMMCRYATPCYEFEMAYSIANLIHGKRKVIDNLFLVRENRIGSAGEIHSNTLLSDENNDEFIRLLARYISNNCSLSSKEATLITKTVIKNYKKLACTNQHQLDARYILFCKKITPLVLIKYLKHILGISSLYKIKRKFILDDEEFIILKQICQLIDK